MLRTSDHGLYYSKSLRNQDFLVSPVEGQEVNPGRQRSDQWKKCIYEST